MQPAHWHTRASLRADLARLGLRPGDLVMVHAAMRQVGRILGGPDALIGAVLDATAPSGAAGAERAAAFARRRCGDRPRVDAGAPLSRCGIVA